MSTNLAKFQKPGRYIGGEVNIRKKDADVRVALCFPDTYEIGMSHIGFRILYEIINSTAGASAERFYAPWVDYEAFLRQNGNPLVSLEQGRPLKDFHIAGFTLQYELSYTNILNMLDMGGIPVRSADRDDRYPIVIAGGPCAVNPLPLIPFVDAFVIGDGEEVIREIIETFACHLSVPGKKEKTLSALARIDGIYVPAIHDTGTQRIRRRFIQDLDSAPFPDTAIVPYVTVVHDRVAIEIARGCTRGCRFCQAGMIYRPVRERSLENVLSLARTSVAATGYEEVSFTSLSSGDYSCLLPLIRNFNTLCAASRTSVSLPSLRVGSIHSDVLKEIKSVRKTGFTIAPEAGTRRLRNVINKDFSDEEYEETLRRIFSEGWQNIKLYFMIGLPTETMTDIDGLVGMAERAMKRGREITRKRVNVNVGISAFVPKPHTPFQWAGQEPAEELRKKQDYLRKIFRRKGINFKGQHVENSLLEAVFARGDQKTAQLIEAAWKLGCRFDGWAEHFDIEKWRAAATSADVDLNEYATRAFSPEDPLPWDFIDIGVKKEHLISEYSRALQQEVTPDCREGCIRCGLECNLRKRSSCDQQPPSLGVTPRSAPAHRAAVPARLRVRFSKTGNMRYISHNEMITAVFRALRRAEMPVMYSAGFHPHPKLSFGPALPVGIEGLNEYFDVELTELPSPSGFMKKLNAELPDGLHAEDAALIPREAPSLTGFISRYAYEITIPPDVHGRVISFISKEQCPVQREQGTVDIRPVVEKAEIFGDTLHITLSDTDAVKVRLSEVLKELLGTGYEDIPSVTIKRVGLYGYNKGCWMTPL